MNTDTGDVVITRDDAIVTIRIDRTPTRNGLTPDTCVELAEAFETAAEDSNVRCVVFGSSIAQA